MDGAVGRSSTLRSLVRPVSPLSRLHKPPLPVETDHLFTPSISRRITRSGRSRSRSPILSSTVHLPTPLLSDLHGAKTGVGSSLVGAVASSNLASTTNTSTTETEEVRRIIIRRSSQGIDYVPYQDLTNPDRNDQSKSSSRPNESSSLGSTKHSLSNRMSRRLRLPPPPSNLDRTQTCPILVRMFYSTNGRHYSLSEYVKGRVPDNEIRINTWIDATLRELADEIRVVCRLARRRGARLQFAAVYPDKEGGFQRRQLGVVITGYGAGATGLGPNSKGDGDEDGPDSAPRSFGLADDSAVTLLSKRFQIGDYIDVAIVEYVPGTLSGWSSGRRPLGPPPSSSEARNSTREELRRI